MKRIPPTGPNRLRRIRAEAMQGVRDIQHWNQANPDDVAIDAGPDLVIARLCDQGLRAAEVGDGDEFARVAGELVAQAERAANQEAD